MVNTEAPLRPSADYLAVVRTRPKRLAAIMRRGDTPDVDALAGWEWRGTNMPATSQLLGIRRFIKGFVPTADGGHEGYNVSVRGADLTSPWSERRQRDGRREWAPFTVTPVDPAAPLNRYLHALLLDYGAVSTPESGVAGRLRDYLVRVVPGSDELLLGHAFMAVGQRSVQVGWFALEPLAPVNAAR
jgi:hypothetical protein